MVPSCAQTRWPLQSDARYAPSPWRQVTVSPPLRSELPSPMAATSLECIISWKEIFVVSISFKFQLIQISIKIMPPPSPLQGLVQLCFCFVWPPYFPQSISADASCHSLTLKGGFVKPTCKIFLVRHICSSCYQTALQANRTYHSFTDKSLFII